jgi:hypothetical protein
MIAVSSSGMGFRALASYLVHGRTGLEEGRIAWTSARNLPTADPTIAATLMRATAAQNVRVERPVYHFALAFDPHDPVDRAAMERVADRVLARLGLEGHQALIVAHRDRAHPHLHVLVNRVHPETGKAWDRWQDMPTIQRVLREEERALGVREVPGHLHAPTSFERTGPETQPPVRPEQDRVREHVDAAEHGAAASRNGIDRSTLIAKARAALPAVREAASWDAVTVVLEERGLYLARRGSGLVVADGERYAKASRVALDLTLRHLEQRLGAMPRAATADIDRVTIDRDRVPESRAPAPAIGVELTASTPPIEGRFSLALARLAQDIAALERGREETVTAREGMQAQALERARRARRDAARERHDGVSSALDAALARTFVDPERARARLLAAVRTEGPEVAIARLRESPSTYGTVVTIERARGFGLLRERDDAPSRQAAQEAATLAHEFVAARAVLDTIHDRSGGQEAARRSIPELGDRPGPHRSSAGAELLERGVRAAVRKLTPGEMQQLHALLTRPQIALATRLRQTVRDAVLGRERGE